MRKKIKILFFIIPIFLVLFFSLAKNVEADTHTATTCSQADVQAAINAAVDGDSVFIPSGDCLWGGSLQVCGASNYFASVCVTKNITLQGAGSGSGGTTITNMETTADGGGDVHNGFIYYPTAPSATATFEMKDIHWNQINSSGKPTITFANPSFTVMQQLKIHDLIVTSSDIFAYFSGLFKGVIYHNNITTASTLQQNVGPGDDGLAAWNAIQKCSGSPLSCSHDDGRNLYWEDNILNIGDTILESGGAGFSWVVRYNKINYIYTSPAFEWHGNYGSVSNSRCSSMDMAVYGNYLVRASGSYQPYIKPRGGMGMIFYNYAPVSGDNVLGIYWQDEAINTAGTCSITTNPQPQNISDSYAWSNVRSDSLVGNCYEEDATGEIAENSDYFCQRIGTFDGSGVADKGGGVGCGKIEDRPTTCTTGVGYWATNNQSCSDLTRLVGATGIGGLTREANISGTLYKCTSTDHWEAYYTPYTYPHPLRNETPTTSKTYTIADFTNFVNKNISADVFTDNILNSRDLGVMMSGWGD